MTIPDVTVATLVPVDPRDQQLQLAQAGFLAGYKLSTRESYVDGLKQWFRWCANAGIHPFDAQRPHIDLYGRWLEETSHKALSTVLHRLCVLRSFYRYCEDEGFIARDPSSRIRLPKVPDESTTQGMTREEVTRFIIAAQRNPVQYALVCLLTLNGLRVGEACGANIEDMGVERGHRTLVVARKGGRRVKIPLSPSCARAIEAAVDGRTSGPILLTQANTRMSRHLAGDVVERIGKRAKLPYHVHPHMLRHAFATVALDAGIPLHDVQDSMDHADPRTTQRYNRNRRSLDRNATHIVSAILAS